MAKRPGSKDEIFRKVSEIENESSRFRMLDRLCGDDSRLRREVLEQLGRELDEDLTHQSPWPNCDTRIHKGVSDEDQTSGYPPGTVIGPYEIVRQIGRGGMGSVYLAKQTKPVVREVALKVVRSGLDSREVIARFENERQTLALMEHPNIARILDAGATDDARPYFVMEYVQGMRITKYCNRHRLDIDQRLQLFADVCSGVQHAHQKGIIHRDLKPSNILVMEVDGRPVPKVIDFGLAKALENPVQLTQKSLYQGFRQIVGTLRYMSPEQASLTSVDVDTRTDIYSLGVVLYELLTGTTPLESRSVSNRAVLAMLASLQYRDPIRPSNRLSQSGTTLSVIADQRRTESSRLKRLLARDLDWIVMKALEKDRVRRYESVSGFAADVHRYLNDEPVVARPPSARYRIAKFVNKNRPAVIAVALLTLTLIAGVIGTTWGLVVAERRAEGERLAREQAQKRLEQIETNNDILSRIFADLNIRSFREGIEPLEAILAKRLLEAAGKLRAESVGEPLVVARMQLQLGYSLVNLGFADDAIPLFEQALETYQDIKGNTHVRTLMATRALAGAYMSAEETERALPMWKQLFETCKWNLGEDDVETIGVMSGLASAYNRIGQHQDALRLLEKTLQYRIDNLGKDHPATLQNMGSLAGTYLYLDDFAAAVPLFEMACEISRNKPGGKDHVDTLARMNGLAHALRYAGEIPRSHEMLYETWRLRKTKLSASHPNTLMSAFSLAESYVSVGDPDSAIELIEQSLPLSETKLGHNDFETLGAGNTLAYAYFLNDEKQKAITMIDEIIALQRQHLGNDLLSTQHSVASHGYFLREADQPDAAIPHLIEAVASSEKYFKLIWAVPQLLQAYWEAGRHDDFRTTCEQQLAAARERYADDPIKMAMFLREVAPALMSADDHHAAANLLQESVAIYETAEYEHWFVLLARLLLVEALAGQDQFDEIEELLPNIRTQIKRYEDHLRCMRNSEHEQVIKRIATRYEAADRDAEAKMWRSFMIEGEGDANQISEPESVGEGPP